MIHYNAKFLRNLELEITMAYSFDKDYPQCRRLIELRRDILNGQALANQAELLPDIIAFNDAICLALRRMFDHAHEIYSGISVFQPGIELEARCFLPKMYPASHPFQNSSRQELWEALCDTGFNPLYESGVSYSLYLPNDLDASFDTYIGMDCTPPNWNERLDQKLTGDLHLINAFHNLFDHTNFALTDFIFCREFIEEINVKIEESHSY